jgi:hypothetical protein
MISHDITYQGNIVRQDGKPVFLLDSIVDADVPALIIFKDNLTFIEAGINPSSTRIIYKVGTPNRSYDPSRTINAITSIEKHIAYYLITKTEVDFTGLII